MIASVLTSKYALIGAVLLSGLANFYGNRLVGTYWYLLWLAPVPILCMAWYHTSKMTFLMAFLAGLIGKLSWFVYLKTVVNVPMAIIFTLAMALVFAGIIVLTRQLVLKLNSWTTVLLFPALYTAFEWIQFSVSADATSSSMAYSQMENLPLIQIAAVAGILGITFMVTLIPSAIALVVYFRKEKLQLFPLCLIAALLIAGVFLFGFLRLADQPQKELLKVGLVVLPEELHNMTHQAAPVKDGMATAGYLKAIDAVAAQGAKVVLLPERALVIDTIVQQQLLSRLARVAVEHRMYIIAGYTNLKSKQDRNSALVIDPQGHILSDYDKVHLVTGWEKQFTPGKDIGLFHMGNLPSAVAICKDLDFQAYIRQYGLKEPRIMFVPAWDFEIDDWLHSRMAVLRGVENGFSIVRTARTGSLTISDRYGRVTAEASSAKGQAASLVAEVDLKAVDTVYAKTGDWLGILSLLLVIAFTACGFIPKRVFLRP